MRLLLLAFTFGGVIVMITAARAADPAYETEVERLSYAIGHQIGQNLKRDESLQIDADALFAAIRDVLSGAEPKLSSAQRQTAIRNYQENRQKQQAQVAADNKQAGMRFLNENRSKTGVSETSSGLQYRILTPGNGESPDSDDTVVVHYRGTLLSGEEFDSSYRRNKPASLPLTGVINGWKEALPMMKKGAKWELYVPSELAYGERGAGGRIGPNETLIFQVELLEIR